MQNMIQQIVEMDQKAQLITEEAQREKVQSQQEILEKKKQIREDFLAQARKRIQLNEKTEREQANIAFAQTQAKHEEASRQLDALYAQNGAQWVDTIVKRALEE
ncbi:MAG TPA: hypothetical protein IAA58_09710 [Candidatus Gallacutalibacter stercoravium]|nr:hypothetical protein [Candidatus Gallacutalibacter stercoravium]